MIVQDNFGVLQVSKDIIDHIRIDIMPLDLKI